MDESAAREQVVFHEHQKKTIEFIDRLGDLLAKPQLNIPSPLSSNNRLVDRQVDSLKIRHETSGEQSKLLVLEGMF